MGRKKTYTKKEAAERALQTFWEQGFQATSLRDLEASTGVNRFGLYDTFKDKEGLFRECIDQYCGTAEEMVADLLSRGVDGLFEFIGRFVNPDPESPSCQSGCLVVTSLLERDSFSEPIQKRLDGYLSSLMDSIRKVLADGHAAGELRADLDIDESVEFVHLLLVGLPTMARISADDSGMRLAARTALRTLESWRV